MYKTILVAVDQSDQREAVLAEAADIATRLDVELHLVSVCDLTQHSELFMAGPSPEIFSRLDTETRQSLEEARQWLGASGIPCRVHAPTGAASEQIALLARQIDADLIVIGHRQLSWLRRLMENSVGRDLVAAPPCSMLIVVEPHQPGE